MAGGPGYYGKAAAGQSQRVVTGLDPGLDPGLDYGVDYGVGDMAATATATATSTTQHSTANHGGDAPEVYGMEEDAFRRAPPPLPPSRGAAGAADSLADLFGSSEDESDVGSAKDPYSDSYSAAMLQGRRGTDGFHDSDTGSDEDGLGDSYSAAMLKGRGEAGVPSNQNGVDDDGNDTYGPLATANISTGGAGGNGHGAGDDDGSMYGPLAGAGRGSTGNAGHYGAMQAFADPGNVGAGTAHVVDNDLYLNEPGVNDSTRDVHGGPRDSDADVDYLDGDGLEARGASNHEYITTVPHAQASNHPCQPRLPPDTFTLAPNSPAAPAAPATRRVRSGSQFARLAHPPDPP